MYAEYKNGNIFRLIESFVRQTAPPESYEIICLVNNTPETAISKSPGYQENQQTLAIGKYLSGVGPLPIGLNEYRRTVLESAKRKGILLHMVDFSSRGIERNIGKIRDIGLHEAIDRFQVNGRGEEGIVAQLDADTVVESRYVEEILRHFSDPKAESLFINLDYHVPEGPEDLFRTSFHQQFKFAFAQWFNTLYSSTVEVGGPQIIAKVKAYQKIGGIAHQDMAEDFKLAGSLSDQTQYKFAPHLRVFASDRARAEGFDARIRHEQLTGEDEFKIKGDERRKRPRLTLLIAELRLAAKTKPYIFDTPEEIKRYFDKYQVPFDYALFKKRVLEQHKTRTGRIFSLDQKIELDTEDCTSDLGLPTYVGSNEYANEAIELFKLHLSARETAKLNEYIHQETKRATLRLNYSRRAILEALKAVIQKNLVTSKDFAHPPKMQEFVQRNPWLIRKLNILRQTHPSPTEALEELKKEFPEWVESFENSRLRRSTALLRAITSFLREAKNNPQDYPTTTEFLKNLNGQTA